MPLHCFWPVTTGSSCLDFPFLRDGYGYGCGHGWTGDTRMSEVCQLSVRLDIVAVCQPTSTLHNYLSKPNQKPFRQLPISRAVGSWKLGVGYQVRCAGV